MSYPIQWHVYWTKSDVSSCWTNHWVSWAQTGKPGADSCVVQRLWGLPPSYRDEAFSAGLYRCEAGRPFVALIFDPKQKQTNKTLWFWLDPVFVCFVVTVKLRSTNRKEILPYLHSSRAHRMAEEWLTKLHTLGLSSVTAYIFRTQQSWPNAEDEGQGNRA